MAIARAFEGATIRLAGTPDQPLFCAVDVCGVLGLTQTTRALENLDDDELTLLKVTSGGQTREMNFVTESGLYHLVFKSRKAAAKRFRRWVTEEVLPEIRKSGAYVVSQAPAALECVSVPEWLASLGVSLTEQANLANLLCDRLARAAQMLRYKDASFREADGFQRFPKPVTELAMGLFLRDARAPVNRTFFETTPVLRGVQV
jgi:prophage antirepressor-like protein